MSDFTLKQLSDGKYTLNQVENMYKQGRISDNVYWEYYHLWRFATYRYGLHTSCLCPECWEGKPEEITTKKLLESMKG